MVSDVDFDFIRLLLILLEPVQAPAARGGKRNSIISRLGNTPFQSSTKIEALRECLDDMQARDPSAKAIVFSQFTSMLDLIAFRLQEVAPHLRHAM